MQKTEYVFACTVAIGKLDLSVQTKLSNTEDIMPSRTTLALAAVAALGLTGIAHAQSGPVAKSCGSDIAKTCADKPHDGSVRICLETNYDQLTAACKKALDTTGGGRGKGLGKRKAS